MTGEALARALEEPPPERDAELSRGARTGFAQLDHELGGLGSGQMWCVSGTPGVGRSVLLTQLAGRWSRGWVSAVGLLSPVDPPRLTAARLVAAASGAPLREVMQLRAGSRRPSGVSSGLATLQDLPLRYSNDLHELDDLMDAASVVLVDDASLVESRRPGSYDLLRRWCDVTGGSAVVAVHSDVVWRAGGVRRQLRAAWSRRADVIIELTRPDTYGELTARAGEADLAVVRNRGGPLFIAPVAFQGHYARFVDMPGTVDPMAHPMDLASSLQPDLGADGVDDPYGRGG